MKPNTTTSALPTAVKGYFEAVNRFDALAAADCFSTNAVVYDENQSYVGRGAIRAWIAECSGKYHPAFTVMRVSVDDNEINLAVAVSGQFPGSAVTLDYELRLRDGKIEMLTIA